MTQGVSNNFIIEEKNEDMRMTNRTILLTIVVVFIWVFTTGGIFYAYIDSQRSLNSMNIRIELLEKKLNPLIDTVNRVKDSITTGDQITSPKADPIHKESVTTAEVLFAGEKPKDSEQYHKVTHGETLYRIAQRYGLSVDEIRQLNNLEHDQLIKSGQTILVGPISQ